MLGFLVLLLVVALIIAAQVRPGAARRAGVVEPACGVCRYPVRGLQIMQCPECGADFRRVGIVVPDPKSPPASLFSLLLSWTVAVALIGGVVTTGLTALPGLRYRRADAHWKLEPLASDGPYTMITVEAALGGEQGVDPQRLEFRSHPKSSESVQLLAMEREDDQWIVAPGSTVGAAGTVPITATFVAFLAAAGADPVVPETLDEAADLLDIADAVGQGRRFKGTTDNAGLKETWKTTLIKDTLAPWFVGVSCVAWGGLWLGGAWLIVRGRRSRMVEAERSDETSFA